MIGEFFFLCTGPQLAAPAAAQLPWCGV